jgi:hypothetical protein
MAKQYLNYDTTTGNITDADGTLVTVLMGFCPVNIEQYSGELVLQLVKQGVSPDEIIKLKNADLI